MKRNLFIVIGLSILLFLTIGCEKGSTTESPSIEISPENTSSKMNKETPMNTDRVVTDLVPYEYFSTEKDISKLTDDELRAEVIKVAEGKGYNVYDLYDVKRSTVDSKQDIVDVDLTIIDLKENDMASTRFVFKGGRVVGTDELEKVAEYKTPLLSKSKEALNNINVANKKLTGVVLKAGEEFSFRFFLGEQTEEDGYQEATVYVKDDDGEVEEKKGLGGGICQVSSTLHALCLDLDMKIKERHSHSKKVKYIDEGLDAAIAGDYYDFKFENTLEYPIAIVFSMDDKEEKVEIYKVYF